MRILVVEDEEKVASFVRQGLEVSGYAVDVAGTGEDALRQLESGEHDMVVLDMMLPGISGLDVVRELRRRGRDVPVLALTARGELDDRIAGLEAGCDDYLPKPFAFEELLARIKALQRRLGVARPGSLTYKDLVLDLSTRVATRGGAKIELTNKEYALLEYLMRRPEQVLPRGELLEQVWSSLRENLLSTFLRRKFM